MTTKYAGKVNAPDFKPGLDWLNVDHPLTMSGLHGKLVILDFWTYCSTCVSKRSARSPGRASRRSIATEEATRSTIR